MCNDLTEFELNWLLELAINGDATVPAALLKRFRELGYAEQLFSQIQASDLGRERLLARARRALAPHAKA
ncbi:hypothetical protein SBC1_47730 (plasmid) [Caballeronia sp. SBC1]|uniref:hypothetical protein n=1 Tax=unclassified Caballeronia TaxID=2646786 RepID=UPI0013E11832|nr:MULTISPECIES: hypothetical protein [unclassified Caballeronia]QIE25954.1 hypothetical protein SBC2_40240 [Caballeronia sp. SBC2]QIN64733.1 hypothetical protein SBC1_47730 [Caballeronia sp. SBC1]